MGPAGWEAAGFILRSMFRGRPVSSCREQGEEHRPGHISFARSNPSPCSHQLWHQDKRASLTEHFLTSKIHVGLRPLQTLPLPGSRWPRGGWLVLDVLCSQELDPSWWHLPQEMPPKPPPCSPGSPVLDRLGTASSISPCSSVPAPLLRSD